MVVCFNLITIYFQLSGEKRKSFTHTKPCISFLLAMNGTVAEKTGPGHTSSDLGKMWKNGLVGKESITKSVKKQRERYYQREMAKTMPKMSYTYMYTYMSIFIYVKSLCTYV